MGRGAGYTVTKTKQRPSTGLAYGGNKSHSLPLPTTDEERERNARLINHVMQIHEIAAQANKKDVLSLRSCFLNYLKLCQVNGFVVSNMAAYASMGFTRESWLQWSRKDDPDVREFSAFVKSTCAMFRETMVADGTINPLIGIFWQRNFDGLRNDTEQIQGIEENSLLDRETGYKDKYRKLLTGED